MSVTNKYTMQTLVTVKYIAICVVSYSPPKMPWIQISVFTFVPKKLRNDFLSAIPCCVFGPAPESWSKYTTIPLSFVTRK